MQEKESLQPFGTIPEALITLGQEYEKILKSPAGERDYNPLFDFIKEIIEAGIYNNEGKNSEVLKRKVRGLGERGDIQRAVVSDLEQSYLNYDHERALRDIAMMRVFGYGEKSPTFARVAAPLAEYHREMLDKSQKSTEPRGAYAQRRAEELWRTWPKS